MVNDTVEYLIGSYLSYFRTTEEKTRMNAYCLLNQSVTLTGHELVRIVLQQVQLQHVRLNPVLDGSIGHYVRPTTPRWTWAVCVGFSRCGTGSGRGSVRATSVRGGLVTNARGECM